MVYHDLVRWTEERGYHAVPPGREVWVHDKDDVTDPGPQIFEIQLPFTRPADIDEYSAPPGVGSGQDRGAALHAEE